MDSSTVINIINSLSAIVSATALLLAVLITSRVYHGQKLLAQRQLLLPLWEYISQLPRINPASPVTPDVVKVANTLELVALCCEGGLIDEKVILRTFREEYMSLFQAIGQCTDIPGLNESGAALLSKNYAASSFFEKLRLENLSRGNLSQP
jgi:hypothetical protein